jgi:hypothetical protein
MASPALFSEGGPAASQLENSRPALTINNTECRRWLNQMLPAHRVPRIDPYQIERVLEGGPAQGIWVTRPGPYHDKGAIRYHG